MRSAKLLRETKETRVEIAVNLDRNEPVKIRTTVPFFDHMLTLMAYHGGFSLVTTCKGDTEIDDHHLVEDTGITLGKAFAAALGDKKGVSRYGQFLLPMDESLSYVAIDLSGRPYLVYSAAFKPWKAGFDLDLIQEFFYAVAVNSGMTLHINQLKGRNNHHIAESMFKGFGRAFGQAASFSGKRRGEIPSTKGKL